LTNHAHMSRTLPGVDETEHVEYRKAIIKHHFDNHVHCGSFCNKKGHSVQEIAQSTKVLSKQGKRPGTECAMCCSRQWLGLLL